MFTQALLDLLPSPNIALPDIMRDVRLSVAEGTNGQQRPWVQARMMEDFYMMRHAQVRPGVRCRVIVMPLPVVR